jgi:hypothetical protein
MQHGNKFRLSDSCAVLSVSQRKPVHSIQPFEIQSLTLLLRFHESSFDVKHTEKLGLYTYFNLRRIYLFIFNDSLNMLDDLA